LVVETSPKNYQAWVKVADAAGGELRGQIARTLASEYDADPASVRAICPRSSPPAASATLTHA
uniref:DNA-primase RepB domain-containing protein n=1 Tax=Salmonella sp. CQ23WZ0172SAL TaxID=3417702 RepID=UPI003D3632D6